MLNNKNIAQSVMVEADGELTIFITKNENPIERAKEVATIAGLNIEDIYTLKREEYQYYVYDGVVYDNGCDALTEVA